MAVIVIAAGIAFPSVSTMYVQYRLRAATDTIRSGWVNARSHAVDESRRYRFSVVNGKGNFRVAPDDPAYWSGSPPSDDQQPSYIKEDALPSGIRFAHEGDAASDNKGDSVLPSVNSGQWETVAIFDFDGTAQDDAEITVELNGGRPMIIKLRAVTGSSTVEYGKVK